MSDDIVNEHAHRSIQHEGETYISLLDATITFAIYRTHINHQAAEITRLRAACDAYFRQVSLMQMKHARHLPALERRIARQRRALAKLYERRHDKNAALATARRDALAEIKQDTDELIEQGRQDGMEQAAQIAENYANRNHVSLNIAAAIRAAAKEEK